ncbi:MAG TPA: nuclear transport factor 2 family protein [Acidimicrobiia bacterium]|nr:nuclear transport factor 2 family protein [Acidimicrobiia bacterium]
MTQQKVKDGYLALNAQNWSAVQALLDPGVIFHVEGREADYVGRPAVMAFLKKLAADVGGGGNIRFLTVTTDGTGEGKRQVSVDRTTIKVRGEWVDHICADSFRFENDLIVEGWICHVDHLT